MSDIEEFLENNSDFAMNVISALKEVLESYPSKTDNVGFALECVKTIIEGEEEKYLSANSEFTDVANYIKE